MGVSALLLWQKGPRKPGAHSQLPSSGEQEPPFSQLQETEQLGPQRPGGHVLSQRTPVGQRQTQVSGTKSEGKRKNGGKRAPCSTIRWRQTQCIWECGIKTQLKLGPSRRASGKR